MSSLKMTFSLASLILIIAFGFVFGTTSVMAHPAVGVAPAQTPDDPTTHTHDGMNPVDAIEDDPTTTGVTENTPAHNSHPTVTISLKPGATVSDDGTMAVITDSDNDPATPTGQTFTLVIDFNQVVLSEAQADDAASVAPTTEQLNASDLTFDIQDMATIPQVVTLTTATTIGTPTVSGTDYSKYEAVVTIGDADGIPSGTADADDKELTFRVVLDAGSVFSLQTLGASPGPGQPAPIYRSGGNAASTLFEFKLVKSLPTVTPTPDTTPPTVMVKEPEMPNNDGDLEFEITFNEAIPAGPFAGFSVDDITVMGVDGVDDGTNPPVSALEGPEDATDSAEMEDVYTLTVTPASGASVTVTVVASGIGDTAAVPNPLDADNSMLSATYDRTPPTVVITAPEAPDADGKLLFSFAFSEPVRANTVVIDRSGSDNVRLYDGRLPVIDSTSDPDMPVYTLLVTPANPAVDTTVLLLGGSVEDMNGNALEADAEATYTGPNAPPVFVGSAPTGLTWCDGEMKDPILLPLARDEEPDTLVYSLDPPLPNSPPADGGLYWETVDTQTRHLKGTAKESDAGDYTWKVTDGIAEAVEPVKFTIVVKPYEDPKAVTNVRAVKVDPETTIGDDIDKVRLTWIDPNPTDYPNMPGGGCIPAVTHYIVTMRKLNTHGQNRALISSEDIATLTVADATVDGNLEYTTDKLDHGTYEFTITAVSRVTRLDNTTFEGVSDVSDEADWYIETEMGPKEKTGYHWIIVDDPPVASTNLRANQTDSPRDAVTLDWIPPAENSDAPVNDIGLTEALYGPGVTDTFGGYTLEVTNQRTAVITTYPRNHETTGQLIPGNLRTYRIDDLEVGEYTARVVAHNIVGKGALSNSHYWEIDVYQPGTPPANPDPTFGDYTIDDIDVNLGDRIGMTLGRATDPNDDALSYSLTKSGSTVLPTGLNFNAVSRRLSASSATAAMEGEYTYTAYETARATAFDALRFYIDVDTGEDTSGTVTEATSLPANGYIVYVRDKNNPPNFGTAKPAVAQWPGTQEMPNLYELFTEGGGGSLQLNVTGVGARQVVFSEVMWAVDLGQVGQDGYATQQWIELRNRTGNPIPISSISFATKDGRPALPQGTDLISNVVGAGNNWINDGKGENGNSTAGSLKAFKSMRRTRYHNDSAGWNPNEWATAGLVYHPNHYGTPGRGEPQGPVVIGTTNVPRSPIIINEISNNANPAYEWIELKNVSGGNVNLKGWEITMVTAIDSDVDLIDFTGADRNVPAGGILLVVKSDPTGDPDHPLAAGWNFGARNTWTVAEPGQANYVPGVNADSPRYMVAAKFNALPDNGEFVLILRDHEGKNNSGAHIRDIAGHMPGTRLRVETANAFTNLWPLSNFHDANAEQNKFTAGTVHRRQHAGVNGTDRSRRDRGANADDGAFRDEGWTGIGYKRNAAPTAQNGGTPGYAFGVLHSTHATANNAVIISEIMSSPGDRNLPQWIELRNTSRTIGVNVDNWRLTITNHDKDSADGADGSYTDPLTATVTLSGRIPPGQTYLIVARNSRNTTNLPSGRIKNAGRTRSQLLMNPYGFELKLESKDGNNYQHVDTAGNLGAAEGRRSRSFADIRWEWPASTEGDRVSIVRVPLNGVPNDGTDQDAWKSFEGTIQADSTDEFTYYGHQNDLGSPGHTAGGVLPVSLSKFRPERMKDTGEIVIRWVTESELNNAGFNILRGEALDGEFTKINTSLIAGKGTTSERHAYEWKDTSAKPNVVYYYQIQDVSLDGEVTTLRTTHLRGNVTAVGKATTTWGKIKALQ